MRLTAVVRHSAASCRATRSSSTENPRTTLAANSQPGSLSNGFGRIVTSVAQSRLPGKFSTTLRHNPGSFSTQNSVIRFGKLTVASTNIHGSPKLHAANNPINSSPLYRRQSARTDRLHPPALSRQHRQRQQPSRTQYAPYFLQRTQRIRPKVN